MNHRFKGSGGSHSHQAQVGAPLVRKEGKMEGYTANGHNLRFCHSFASSGQVLSDSEESTAAEILHSASLRSE